MNNNQRKFFEEAIPFFGDKAHKAKWKNLTTFASNRELIVPTSFLKKHCKTDSRGVYDLFLSGIGNNNDKDDVKLPATFDSKDDVIVDTSAFVDSPKSQSAPKKKKVKDVSVSSFNVNNPIYLVINSDHCTVSVHRTIEGAYKGKEFVLHEHGNKELSDVVKEVKNTGKSIIDANQSCLWCAIITMELKS